jgi:hypothetical protein
MPIYEFACSTCGLLWELILPLSRGVHQIVGLGPVTASFPAELKWDSGWAKLLVVQPRYVIYKEQDIPHV